MKKVFCLIMFLQLTISAQTNSIVKHVFYDLPLDKPRADIQKAIRSDKRFKETQIDTNKDTSLFLLDDYMCTYIGLCNNMGVIKSKADSVEFELTFGSGMGEMKKRKKEKKKKRKTEFISSTYLILRYFYTSADTVEKEYKNLLGILQPIFAKTYYTHIDTIYTDSPIRRQFKAYGVTLFNPNANYHIEVLNAKITKSSFGLYIEFKREDKTEYIRHKKQKLPSSVIN